MVPGGEEWVENRRSMGNICPRFTCCPYSEPTFQELRFMNKTYYDTIGAMEKKGVNKEYINGWACGFLHNPKREEQRLNEAYDAGYNDGTASKVDGYNAWVKK
jgi:hypothetical protein